MQEQGLLDRVLPEAERQTAIWMAIGIAIIGGGRYLIESLAFRYLTSQPDIHLDAWKRVLVEDALVAVFALVVVWAFIRFSRMPREFALYLALVESISAATSLAHEGASAVLRTLIMPGVPDLSSASTLWRSALLDIVVVALVILAAWFAQRPRDTSEPDVSLLNAIGWKRPFSREAQLAIGFAICAGTLAIARLATYILSVGLRMMSIRSSSGIQGFQGAVPYESISALLFPLVDFSLIVAVAWLLVSRWHQPVSWWLVYLGASATSVVSLLMVSFQGGFGFRFFVEQALLFLGFGIAPLLGAGLAVLGGKMSEPSGTLPAQPEV